MVMYVIFQIKISDKQMNIENFNNKYSKLP